MNGRIRKMVFVAVLAALPAISSAALITADDGLGNSTSSGVASATGSAGFIATVGDFEVSALVNFSSLPELYSLNTTSVQAEGVGTLTITALQTGLSAFAIEDVQLLGTASVSDVASQITVEHFVDTGSGFQTIGSAMDFFAIDGNNQSDNTGAMLAITSTFDMKSVITVTTVSGDQVANVNATLTANPVPLPAAAWLFISALAGVGVLGRRKLKT